MESVKTVTVFGATGRVGSEFITMALEAGAYYKLRVLVRDQTWFHQAQNSQVEVLEGDATNAEDVAQAIAGADIVASFLGNPEKNPDGIHIMSVAASNIMDAAAAQDIPPRCLMISSVGVGGSSWLIRLFLQMICGTAGFQDYEDAEARIRSDKKVPFAVIRPYALTDNPGTGKYKVIQGATAHFAKTIARADVARFFLDCVQDSQWDGPNGVNVGGA